MSDQGSSTIVGNGRNARRIGHDYELLVRTYYSRGRQSISEKIIVSTDPITANETLDLSWAWEEDASTIVQISF